MVKLVRYPVMMTTIETYRNILPVMLDDILNHDVLDVAEIIVRNINAVYPGRAHGPGDEWVVQVDSDAGELSLAIITLYDRPTGVELHGPHNMHIDFQGHVREALAQTLFFIDHRRLPTLLETSGMDVNKYQGLAIIKGRAKPEVHLVEDGPEGFPKMYR